MFVTGGDKDMSTGDRIRARREQLGMTQDELAHKLGYKSRSSVNKIELGKQELTQKKLRQLLIYCWKVRFPGRMLTKIPANDTAYISIDAVGSDHHVIARRPFRADVAISWYNFC